MRCARLLLVLLAAIGLTVACTEKGTKAGQTGAATHASVKCPFSIISWLRMPADSFGCMMEHDFNYHDPDFHCGTVTIVDQADDSGPALPVSAFAKIHPDISTVELGWEHGNLRTIDITFAKKMSVKYLREYFSLPTAKRNPSLSYSYDNPNIEMIYYGEEEHPAEPTSIDSTDQIGLSGFEHMGPND